MALLRMMLFVAVVALLSVPALGCTSSLSVNIGVSEAAQCAYVFSLPETDNGSCPTLQEAMSRWLSPPLSQKPDLIAHYAFEDNLMDSTNYDRDGSLTGQVTYADGQCGKAVNFDGQSKVVVDAFRNHPSWGSKFSVSVWFKRTGVVKTGYAGIVNTGYGSTGSWEIRMGRDTSGQMIGGGIVTADSSATWNYVQLVASFGEWHHVVMTYDGSKLLYYIDNQLQSGNKDCCHGDIISKNTPLTIGQAGVGTSREFFIGLIDEVKVFRRALTACDVDKLFQTPCASLGSTFCPNM